MKRAGTLYLALLLGAVALIAGLLHAGGKLPPPPGLLTAAQPASHGSTESAPGLLLLQLTVIVALSRASGWIFTRIGQPAVIGEMAAGILLGPSLIGSLAPEWSASVFPTASMGTLKLLSQLGVCLFLFVVGMELDIQQVRSAAPAALFISHASIVVPYVLGVALAWFLYTPLAGPGSPFAPFALFMGISMSITAFPVLARILQERSLTQTRVGTMAITCAAVDDVTAWTLLTFVVAIARTSRFSDSLAGLGWVLVYLAAMVFCVHPILRSLLVRSGIAPSPRAALSTALLVLLASAWCTDAIGIHALFGSFLAGAIMPEAHGLRHRLSQQVEHLSSVLLLPVFFAFTGLRTEIGLLTQWIDWLTCLAIIAVATGGKLGASTAAARLSGLPWRDSLQIGALMNTRGLMELIALNLGYELGILSPRIFAMLVVMALATTIMTGPLLRLIGSNPISSPDPIPVS